MRFNYAHEDGALETDDPEYIETTDAPPITAYGNLQISTEGSNPILHWIQDPEYPNDPNMRLLDYQTFIKILNQAWKLTHGSHWFIQPFDTPNVKDNADHVILYSLVEKVAKDNFSKPRRINIFNDIENEKSTQVWMQAFINTIKFSAISGNPEVAERNIELFEDFMIEITPIMKMFGIEDIFYFRRPADTGETRYGTDICIRSVMYRLTTQKILTIDNEKLEDIYIHITTWDGEAATPGQTILSD